MDAAERFLVARRFQEALFVCETVLDQEVDEETRTRACVVTLQARHEVGHSVDAIAQWLKRQYDGDMGPPPLVLVVWLRLCRWHQAPKRITEWQGAVEVRLRTMKSTSRTRTKLVELVAIDGMCERHHYVQAKEWVSRWLPHPIHHGVLQKIDQHRQLKQSQPRCKSRGSSSSHGKSLHTSSPANCTLGYWRAILTDYLRHPLLRRVILLVWLVVGSSGVFLLLLKSRWIGDLIKMASNYSMSRYRLT